MVTKRKTYEPESASFEQARADLVAFPKRLAGYRDQIAAWQATGAAQPPSQLLADGLSVYYIIRRYDFAWALEVREGHIPMDWEETRRICGIYAQWREPSIPVVRSLGAEPLDENEAANEPVPIPAFRYAFLRATFAAHANVDELREANEWADRWIASHSNRKRDAVGR